MRRQTSVPKKIRPEREGTEKWTVGCSAGPGVSFDNLAHELGHMVQFRSKNYSDRFKYGRFTFRNYSGQMIGGQFYAEHASCRPTLRELETIAIQQHILEIVGVKNVVKRVDSFLKSLKYMPDECFASRLNYHDIVLKHYQEYDKESIKLELKILRRKIKRTQGTNKWAVMHLKFGFRE